MIHTDDMVEDEVVVEVMVYQKKSYIPDEEMTHKSKQHEDEAVLMRLWWLLWWLR